MARARSIKPGFFANDDLAEMRPLVRLLFAGLWCLADRDGRLLDRPKKIKADVMAYDSLNVEAALKQLAAKGFIVRYEVDGQRVIQVCNWLKHQHPHPQETPSELPPPPGSIPDFDPPSSGSEITPKPDADRLNTGVNPSGTSSSGTSSSGTSSSGVVDAAAALEVDDDFKLGLEDQFWEQLGGREAVRIKIAAALGHKSRLNTTDLRAYLRNWLLGDVERSNSRRAPPVRRNGSASDQDADAARADIARKFAHLGAKP